MQTDAHADDRAVATALEGMTVRGERNLLAESAAPDLAGARAALETFYFAFNMRSLELARRLWADDPLVQLDTPVAGVVRGSAGICALYERGFAAHTRVQSVFEDIVAYETPDLVVFTGRERGAYTPGGAQEATPELTSINTTCICVFRYIAAQGGWRQVYHHVALDDPDQLARFQRAVRGA